MSIIKVKVFDRELSFTDMPTISAGAEGVDSVKFEFDGDTWSGYSKTCVFFKNRSEYCPEILDLNNIAKIPKTIIENEGIIHFGLCGVKDNTRLTSTILTYGIKNGVYCNDDIEYDEFAKTNFEQLMEDCAVIKESHQAINADIADIKEDIEVLNTKDIEINDLLTASIADTNEQIDNLDNRVSNVESSIDDIEEAIHFTYDDSDIGKILVVTEDNQIGLKKISNHIFALKDNGLELANLTGPLWFSKQVQNSLVLSGMVFNVRHFGAQGDGETDDGWAIQTAIDNCRALCESGIIYFPAGTYNITRTLFYYSNMTFQFDKGAVIRTMTDVVHNSRLPSIVFAPYFETDIAFLHNGKGISGVWSNRYGVENVVFNGGTISGNSMVYDPTTETWKEENNKVVFLTCLCKNIKFYNMTFDGNIVGGHFIEINSSTNVTVRDCTFVNYVSNNINNNDGIYTEAVQIDAATSSSVGSKYIITKHTEDYVAPNGTTYNKWYTYEDGCNYRSLGGYFDFTLLPPGNQYTTQGVIEDKLKLSYDDILESPGFHQCCHNIEITGCYFENNEDANCYVSAIGSHTYFDDPGSESSADELEDKHSGINIHDNTFVWGSNHFIRDKKTDNSFWRGVISFGTYEKNAWRDPRVCNVIIHGNMFYRNRTYLTSSDIESKEGYAITACYDNGTSCTRYTNENNNDLPQTKYRIYGNFYAGINGWDSVDGAISVTQDGTTLKIE